MKKLLFEQKVPCSLEQAFSFFCDENNLEKITPPWLHFKVLKKSTSQIQKGTLIYYKLSIKKIPARWTTLISDWNPPHSFVDEQLKGPYQKWHHLHEFIALDDHTTLMKDTLHYQVPLGFLGDLLLGKYIKNDIQTIFEYRKKIIENIFIPI